MYNIGDYYKYLSDFIHINIFGNRRLSVIMFYATNKCNSKCNICNIWDKQPKENLSFEVIKRTLDSKCIDKRTRVGFEGGEFLLHPEVDEILDYANNKKLNYELLTNGLLPDKLFDVVKKYSVPRVYISLDGAKDTYINVRGTDGYDLVLRSIDLIRNLTKISIIYTINPWNKQKDLDQVIRFCKERDLDLRIGIYSNMEFFDTTKRMHEIDYEIETDVDISAFPENQEFLDLYRHWQNGDVSLPCYSIRQELVVYPNGDIPICQNKQIILGNLHERSLDDIIAAHETIELQKEQKYCNGCWISFHRKFEVALYRSLKYIPKAVIRRILGDFKLPKYWNGQKRALRQPEYPEERGARISKEAETII